MSQIKKLPKYGQGSLALHEGHDLKELLNNFERLTRCERWNMKGKGYAGPQAKRLEFGEKVLDLLNLMYGWEKHYEEST